MDEISRPDAISRFKKQRFLLSMSEDEFRDKVVRPLFLRQGLSDGRDLCGPSEKGKDALFVAKDSLGIEDIYVVQTKKGKINLARKAGENLLDAVTQLRTAANTRISLIKSKTKQFPVKVILCVSGTINEAARNHITEEIGDPRLLFMDSDELIPKIDELFSELWLGIDAEIAPYFRKLKQAIERSDEALNIADLLPQDSQRGVATDRGFVMLELHRMTLKHKRERGQMIRVPDFEHIPITALLKKRNRHQFVIFGAAGSGKSTSLKRLAYLLASRGLKFATSERPAVPILLRATDILAGHSRSLVEICDAECKKITASSTSSFTADDLAAGRLFVMIDALDEIPDDNGRGAVVGLTNEFHEHYPDCTIVLTSRDYNSIQSLKTLKHFEEYNVSPINYKQAQQIIKAVQKGKNLPADKSQELLRRLEEVHGMELNPLLVTVFAATSEYSRQDIPANITELFKKFTEMMLGRWDASKGFKYQYHGPLKDFVLTKVAFEMHRNGHTKLDIDEFDSIIRRELVSRGHQADIDELRDEIINRSGLFSLVDRNIEFRHLMIQEFFAGRGIPSMDYLHTIITDSWWRRAIVFYFGEHPDNSAALRSAIESLGSRSIEERYYSALTLGLSIQACYLVEVKDKIDIYQWVVDSISSARDEFLEAGESQSPLNMFLLYYLVGRDSVALSVLNSRVQDILDKWSNSEYTQDEKDLRIFWTITGLVESGAMSEVERIVRKFKPSDARLLLGIHLGCYLTEQVRVCTKEQSQSARKICDLLAGRIDHLRAQLFDEFKSELLEMRKGTIETIGEGSNVELSNSE